MSQPINVRVPVDMRKQLEKLLEKKNCLTYSELFRTLIREELATGATK